MRQESSVVPLSPQQPSQNGNNGSGKDDRLRNVELKLAAVENEIKHLATKTDIADLKTHIETKMNNNLKWNITTLLSVVAIAISTIVITILLSSPD